MEIDYEDIFSIKANKYERLICREDYMRNIPKKLSESCSFVDKDIIDLGTGTGRLTCLLAPAARTIIALDNSKPMLDITVEKLGRAGFQNWKVEVADLISLTIPAEENSADIVVAGWSICFVANSEVENWKENFIKILTEVKRVLRIGGTFIILETLGTGFEEPNPPSILEGYFQMLRDNGFSYSWIRTDYRFENVEEAYELTEFFFGKELAERVQNNRLTIVPECTSVWKLGF